MGEMRTDKLIYAADDEANIREIIDVFLTDAGYEVVLFENGDSLLEKFIEKPCDLVILDIMMPGTDGIAICKRLREISSVPIIILTAKETEADYMIGITSGGDDYLTKPFSPTLLVLRIKALLRRVGMEHATEMAESELTFSDLVYSPTRHAVLCGGRNVNLTELEMAFLVYLMRYSEESISRDRLLDEIWGLDSDTVTRVIDETVRRIRRKLRDVESAATIVTVWGYGYRIGEVK